MTEKRGPTIPVTESMILHAAEDANLMLLDGDLPRHDSETVWDYHRRVQDEIWKRVAAETAAMVDRVLDGGERDGLEQATREAQAFADQPWPGDL